MSRAALGDWLAECRARVDDFLDKALPPASEPPQRLHEALRYAVFSEGKRLRPALAFATAAACGAESDRVLPVAAAVELVHAYSLAHDDLPAMDAAAERRGRPSLHVRFGEADAILAGDALLAAAFGQLADERIPAAVVARLSHAAGSQALVGGQSDDLAFDPSSADAASVRSIHLRKTAELFGFAVWGAGRVCGAPEADLERLERFARHYGLAFQALDDLLDDDRDECSILLVMSEREARAEIEQHVAQACRALDSFGERAEALRGLAERVAGRLP